MQGAVYNMCEPTPTPLIHVCTERFLMLRFNLHMSHKMKKKKTKHFKSYLILPTFL